MGAFVRSAIDSFENRMMAGDGEVAAFDAKMQKIYDRKPGKKRTLKKIRRQLTKFTVGTADEQFAKWVKLEEDLLVKFIDGNVKAQDENGEFLHTEYSEGIPKDLKQPGYTEKWKEATAKDNGKILESR